MAGRILGFVNRPDKANFPVVLHNVRETATNEAIEGQGEDGRVDIIHALRNIYGITADGDVEPTEAGASPELPKAGEVMTIKEGSDSLIYRIVSCEKTSAAGAYQTCSITLERKDEAEIVPYSEVHKTAPPAK